MRSSNSETWVLSSISIHVIITIEAILRFRQFGKGRGKESSIVPTLKYSYSGHCIFYFLSLFSVFILEDFTDKNNHGIAYGNGYMLIFVFILM